MKHVAEITTLLRGIRVPILLHDKFQTDPFVEYQNSVISKGVLIAYISIFIAEYINTNDKLKKIDEKKYTSNGTYTKGVDPEVTCWHCKKTFLCDIFDATCRMCGAPYAKSRCEEFNFIPTKDTV
jgi:hypothetical protein